MATAQSLTFVHPYDDPEVIAGQGTVGMEILRQCNPPPQAIFVPVGGGGLIAGIAAYVKRLRPQIKIIGVEPIDADAMARSLCQGQRVRLQQVGLFADGVAVKSVGVETFRLCQELVDDMVVVDTDAICAAIKDVFEDTRSILEPAGALSIAGAKAYVAREKLHDTTLVAVASGANMNFERLRHVSERAELGEEREAILAVMTARIASRSSPSSARSETCRRRSKFILAPDATATSVVSCSFSRATYALAPAMLSAPAGSRIERVSSNTSLIAAQMASDRKSVV